MRIFILIVGLLGLLLLTFSFIIIIDDTVESSGIVLPKSEFIIKSSVNGIVSEILVKDGSYVKMYDTLVVFNNTATIIELQKVERDLLIRKNQTQKIRADLFLSRNELQTKLDLSELELTNKKLELQEDTLLKKIDGLISNGVIPFQTKFKQLSLKKAELYLKQNNEQRLRTELNRYDLSVLENEILKLYANIKLLKENIHKSVLLAPSDGIIYLPDQRNILGSFFSEGQVLFELVDVLKGWKLKLRTSDRDIPFVKNDQKVKIYFNAFPYMKYKIFNGKVVNVISSPESQDMQYTVYVDLFDIDKTINNSKYFNLKKGMIANCKIIKESKKLIEYAIDKLLDKSSI